MPIQTRCPSCGAAVAVAAAWCSLCHADLRPAAATPVTHAQSVLPGSMAPVSPAPQPTAAVTSTPAEPEVRRVGRHSREYVEAAPEPQPRRGRHAADSSSSVDTLDRATLDPELRELAADAAPDDIDEIADRMIDQLAIVEPRDRLFNPNELPGGKWGFMGALMVAIIAVVLGFAWIVGLVVNR